LLNGLRKHVHGNNNPVDFFNSSTVEIMETLQGNTVFHMPHSSSAASDAFFDFEQTFFANYIPVTDERGALINRSNPIAVAVSANADPALAWAFIEALLTDTGLGVLGGRNGSVHISRLYAEDYLQRGISEELRQFGFRSIATSESVAVSTATSRILEYAELPTMRPSSMLIKPHVVVHSTLMDFLNSETSPEAALQDMENAILHWMGQEQHIEAYVPTPIDDITEGLPVRTLTIHADNRHTAMFQQAAVAMNASWQERNVGYTFELFMDDWPWNDSHAGDARNARLQTELMAGQGPDIFIWANMNLRNFAQIGIIADIYPLMDACELTNRSDFFEHVLEAFEFNGGLYIFPTSFGFHQVGINAHIPQQFIATHTARETITLREIMDTYVRVRSDSDFAHMRSGLNVASFHFDAIAAAMQPFIDFEARTVDLTHPRFIETLEAIRHAFDGRQSITSGGWSNAPGPDFFSPSGEMGDIIFDMSVMRGMAASPFFPRTENHFIEYRPLTDEVGRLLIQPFGESIWATLSITAAGQPELAWEFITYLLREYPHATGRARVCPIFGSSAYWAGQSIATPILRENAHMPRYLFETKTNPAQYGRFMGWDFSGPREQYIDMAMTRLAELNEMPVALANPIIHGEVFGGPDGINLLNFMDGVITAEAFAQMMQNSVSLWLIE